MPRWAVDHHLNALHSTEVYLQNEDLAIIGPFFVEERTCTILPEQASLSVALHHRQSKHVLWAERYKHLHIGTAEPNDPKVLTNAQVEGLRGMYSVSRSATPTLSEATNLTAWTGRQGKVRVDISSHTNGTHTSLMYSPARASLRATAPRTRPSHWNALRSSTPEACAAHLSTQQARCWPSFVLPACRPSAPQRHAHRNKIALTRKMGAVCWCMCTRSRCHHCARLWGRVSRTHTPAQRPGTPASMQLNARRRQRCVPWWIWGCYHLSGLANLATCLQLCNRGFSGWRRNTTSCFVSSRLPR